MHDLKLFRTAFGFDDFFPGRAGVIFPVLLLVLLCASRDLDKAAAPTSILSPQQIRLASDPLSAKLELSNGIKAITVSGFHGAGHRSLVLSTGTNFEMPQGCAGGCIDPHPNAYRWWWGQANGCWVPQWRQWPEGCTHYQMFNSCSNYWDPQIHWTCCVH